MGRITESIQAFFEPLTMAQRTMFVLMITLLVIILGGVFYWTLKPEYTILFGSMNNEAAREVAAELEEQGVSFRVEDSGRSIYVRSNQVHELRMRLASVGLAAHSDVQGYELFDENTLGMTDFMQRINKKRALEGELSRTIASLEQVENSRVHLVLPERTPFQRTTVEASASIILTLKRGQGLSKDQISGMTALVAGSVEGLGADAITVLDQNGNRLTDSASGTGGFASGSSQMELRQKTEAYLTERGQTMLDRVLGPGNSILRVAAEHDFDRLTRESDLIDPDSRTIISEERRTDSQNHEDFQQVPIDEFTPINLRGESVLLSSRNNENVVQTRNYEVNKVRELFEKPEGDIRRISASLLLNYKQTREVSEEGETVLVDEPYTQDELQELQEVVRTALGIQMNRGDELTITQIRFFDPAMDELYPHGEQPVPWNQVIRWSLILAALLAFALLIYNMSKRFRDETSPVLFQGYTNGQDVAVSEQGATDQSEGDSVNMSEEEENFYNRKLSPAARKQLDEKSFVVEEIRDFIEMQPDEAASVVRAMMTFSKKVS
ncbi:flagellar basal-body MS-ring/collar protein FliF [Balneolales bacterium ANBcel1]|nr:flagellar basal-body MS-ring/collar protein FliF [Balneolales bacterium ANBcel1]